jgi:hypothetical protein
MPFYVAAESRGTPPKHPVDEVLPIGRLAVYGTQHVLAFCVRLLDLVEDPVAASPMPAIGAAS